MSVWGLGGSSRVRFGGIPWCLVRCFQGVFSGGLWYPTGFRGCVAWSGAWGWCVRGKRGFRAGPQASCVWVVFWGCGCNKGPPGAWCSTGGPCDGECGGVLLSHILSGAVPSPCQALASGFGMGSGRLTWAMAAANLQFFFPPLGWGMVPGGGPGTGGWTRCFVVPRFVTMRSLSPGMPHAAVGAW